MSTAVIIPSTVAGIAIAGFLFLCIFIYCSCIRKSNQKDKIYSMMEEAKLEDEVVIIEETKQEFESDEEED